MTALCSAFMLPALAIPGYRLHQTSEFYGESTAEISASTMRLQAPKYGLKLHIAKPDYTMTAVNDRNKFYAVLPVKQWCGFMTNQHPLRTISEPRVLKRGTAKIAGLDTQEYWVNCANRPSVKQPGAGPWHDGLSYNTQYWVTKKISPPPDAYQIFTKALNMPADLGYPVRMVQYNQDGRKFVTFDTKLVERCNVADKLAVPKGYAKAKDEMTLLVGGSADSEALAALLSDDDDLSLFAGPGSKSGGAARGKVVRGWVPGMDLSGKVGTARVKTVSGSWVPGQD